MNRLDLLVVLTIPENNIENVIKTKFIMAYLRPLKRDPERDSTQSDIQKETLSETQETS